MRRVAAREGARETQSFKFQVLVFLVPVCVAANTFFQMTINTVFTLFKVEFLLHIKFCTLLPKRQPENRTSPNSEQVFTLSRVKHFLGSLRKDAEDSGLCAEVCILWIISLPDQFGGRKGGHKDLYYSE